MAFLSPLRYPGGKRRLANFIKYVFVTNDLLDGNYAEPFAGGASVALSLLFDEYVQNIWINDLDNSIYAFWHSALNETEKLCRWITDTPVTIEEWYRQKQVQDDESVSPFELGCSTFFLNRTNRSGIISGGVIGGKKQAGQWKLDARYNKKDLVKRIQKIARCRNRIHLYNQDAVLFIRSILSDLSESTLIYLDPPYYVKGKQMLYRSYYEADDHTALAHFVKSLDQKWIVSYDNAPEIRELYKDFRKIEYTLSYSAQARYKGSEVIFYSDGLAVDGVNNPVKVSPNNFH